MSLNLKMVTFDIDYTQFLVDAENYEKAIDLAIEANRKYGPYDDNLEADIEDRTNYSIDEVVDMDYLGEIMRRDDYLGNYNGTLIFNY